MSDRLTISPDAYRFASHELGELKKILADVDQHTLVTPVTSARDVSVSEEGKLPNGYVFSTGALMQLCGALAPGLANLVPELAGHWRKPGEEKRIFSTALAIEILNRVIKLRFDRRLVAMQLVRNTKSKQIDGIVGAKYRYLANSDFLERAAAEVSRRDAVFHEACLYGRHMVVRFIGKTGTNLVGDNYLLGYHFGNAEIGGKAVRAACLLIRQATGDSMLMPYSGQTGGRVFHSGHDFDKRLQRLLTVIADGELPDDLEEKASALASIPLGLTDGRDNKRRKQLATILVRRKLTLQFAQQVLSSSAMQGRELRPISADELPEDQRRIIAGRTGYDLLTALINEARNLAIDQKEIAEQAAYAVLTGKVILR